MAGTLYLHPFGTAHASFPEKDPPLRLRPGCLGCIPPTVPGNAAGADAHGSCDQMLGSDGKGGSPGCGQERTVLPSTFYLPPSTLFFLISHFSFLISLPPKPSKSHSTPRGPALTTGVGPSDSVLPALAWMCPHTTSCGRTRVTVSATALL